jgi:hypothetical protein
MAEIKMSFMNNVRLANFEAILSVDDPIDASALANCATSVIVFDSEYNIVDCNHLASISIGYDCDIKEPVKTFPEGPIGYNLKMGFEAAVGIEDEEYSGPWPSAVTMGYQIMVDAIDRALETVVYSFRTNLVAPSGMLYFVNCTVMAMDENRIVFTTTNNDPVHHDWMGYIQMQDDNSCVNVRGHTYTQDEMDLIVTWVECDTDEEAAEMLGVQVRTLNRKLEAICEKAEIIGGKKGLLRRMARPYLDRMPTKDNIIPLTTPKLIWDTLRLQMIPKRLLPKLGEYELQLKRFLDRFDNLKPTQHIKKLRETAGKHRHKDFRERVGKD